MILRTMTVSFAVLLIASATAQAQTQSGQTAATPNAAVMDGLRALIVAHEAAMNKRDAEAVAATYSNTADQIFIDEPRVVGRDAIREQLRQIFAAPPNHQRFNLALTSARMLTPNIAIVETDATFTGAPQLANRGTMVVVRSDGGWLIESLRIYPAQAAKR